MTNWHLHDGAPDSPVLMHVPHASVQIPSGVRQHLLLDDAALALEVDRMTDSGTAELASAVADTARVRPWQFVNALSRLVVDPERFPDDREEMLAAGMGAVYTRTSYGKPLRGPDRAHEAELLATVFEPYAVALTEAVASRLVATDHAVIMDVHSFPAQALPYELHADDRRPQVCLGTDSRHTPAWLVALAQESFAEFDVALDEPFRGTYVPLRYFGVDERVLSLMVEVRRDVPPDGPALVAALTALVDGLPERLGSATP